MNDRGGLYQVKILLSIGIEKNSSISVSVCACVCVENSDAFDRINSGKRATLSFILSVTVERFYLVTWLRQSQSGDETIFSYSKRYF